MMSVTISNGEHTRTFSDDDSLGVVLGGRYFRAPVRAIKPGDLLLCSTEARYHLNAMRAGIIVDLMPAKRVTHA